MIDVFKKLNIITAKGELNKKAVHLVQSFSGLEQEVNILTDFMPIDTPLNIRLKLIKDGITANPVCAHPNCNNLTQYKMAKSKFDEYCCPQCYRTDPTAYKKQQGVMLEKYGVINASQLPTFWERRRVTVLERFGVDHPMKDHGVKSKVLETKSVNDPNGSKATEKRSVTNILKYGTATYAESQIPQDVLKKINDRDWLIDTFVIKMGSFTRVSKELGVASGTLRSRFDKLGIDRSVERLRMLQDRVDEYATKPLDDTIKNRQWMVQVISERWTITDIATMSGCSYTSVVNWAIKHGLRDGIQSHITTSSYEVELRDFISKCYPGPIEYNNRKLIYPKELDVLLPDLNIAIEINGISYHSESMGGKDSKYHIDKHNACADKGVRLVQIWGNEWINSPDIVKSRILSILGKSSVLYARNCEVVQLSMLEMDSFFTENHIQGNSQASVLYGLRLNGEIVAGISFGKPRFNTQHEYELIRYCNKIGFNIVGGASRLFKRFINDFNPQSVITYSAVRWNTGNMYSKLGFSHIGRSKPGYYYFHTSNCNEMFHRFKFQKHKLASILSSFDPTLSEFENMLNHGYDRIWDCGNDSFEWINEI